MGNYNNKCISVADFQYKYSLQIPFDGYVEGLGYASSVSSYTMDKRKYYGEPESYFATNIIEQRLEISQETIACSQKNDVTVLPNQSAAGRIIKASLACSTVLLADNVTGIGIADDILIPFILAGGTIIATIAYFYEKSVGQGNKSYPGPWNEIQLDKGTMQRQYGYTPPSEPPFNDNFNIGKWGIVLGATVAGKQIYEGMRPQAMNATDTINYLKTHDKKLQFEQNCDTMQIREKLKRLKGLMQKVELEKQMMPADNTRVVKIKPIEQIKHK